MIELPSADELRRLLDYDPETGRFTWNIRGVDSWDKRWAGREAFACDWNGYKVGSLCGRRCVSAHRVAYKHFHGIEAVSEVDHINGDRTDNRIVNLRIVTTTENRRNAAAPRTNTSGVVGVYYHSTKRRWKAQITLKNRSKHLGYFDTKEDAVACRRAAEREHGFHPNHGRMAHAY